MIHSLCQELIIVSTHLWSAIIHNTWRVLWLLEMTIRKQYRHKKGFVCHTGVQRHKYAIWINELPRTFLDSILPHLDTVQVVYVPRSPRWHDNRFQLGGRTHSTQWRNITNLTHVGVMLKIKKCHFFPGKVECLGHMINHGWLKMDKSNVTSLQDAQPPTKNKQLRSFLCLCNVYRRLIYDFTGLTRPLNKILRKETPYAFAFDI